MKPSIILRRKKHDPISEYVATSLLEHVEEQKRSATEESSSATMSALETPRDNLSRNSIYKTFRKLGKLKLLVYGLEKIIDDLRCLHLNVPY